MNTRLTRRDFLKLSSLSLLGMLMPLPPDGSNPREFSRMRGRVTIDFIHVYKEPDLKAERIARLKRDTVFDILEVLKPPNAPKHNPRFYRTRQGFVYSAYVQRVDKAHLNGILDTIPENGRLGEVTVPLTQSLRKYADGGWEKLYRLYYSAVFWITGIEEGPDGKPWYELTDDLLKVHYFVPAAHIRPVHPAELHPISPDVPFSDKRIRISIAEQILTAYEGDRVVLRTQVSTGIPNPNLPSDLLPTNTPEGSFHISVKYPSRHMGDGELTPDLRAYELPGVPWVSFFHGDGYGLHGTYWHDNFGRMMSHGCVNMRNEDALWIYRWSMPTAEPGDWYHKGRGTSVNVG